MRKETPESFDLFLNDIGADFEDKQEDFKSKSSMAVGYFNGISSTIDVIKALTTEETSESMNRLIPRMQMMKDKALQDIVAMKSKSETYAEVVLYLKAKMEQRKALLENPNIGVRPEAKETVKSRKNKEK